MPNDESNEDEGKLAVTGVRVRLCMESCSQTTRPSPLPPELTAELTYWQDEGCVHMHLYAHMVGLTAKLTYIGRVRGKAW